MLHIPILRSGHPYESVEKTPIVHQATGEPVALVSQANSGLLVRDLHRMDDTVLEKFRVADLIALCRKAADLFMTATLPLGNEQQTFEDYVRQLSATTGMPVGYCRNNANKIHKVLAEMETILAGLTRGVDLEILDRGHGSQDGRTLSFFREGRLFGAVLPSNSPGVHALWIPAIALKTPIVLKPGREEPWTPWRVIQAFIAAGMPREAFGFYPTDHGGAAELLRNVPRSMLFGDSSTTRPWHNDPRVELHGPGYSKILFGDDAAADWAKYVDLMASSIAANAGRSCINVSGVWTPAHAREIADALAQRFAKIEALPVDDPKAEIAAFNDPNMAERISAMIDQQLREPGAVDLTEQYRGAPRLVRRGRCAYLLPTIIYCEDREHPLANREFLFPFASVVPCPTDEMPDAIGPTLIVTALTADKKFAGNLMAAANIDRLNLGPIPTWQLNWDQPHEGNLFEHLYRRRPFQTELLQMAGTKT